MVWLYKVSTKLMLFILRWKFLGNFLTARLSQLGTTFFLTFSLGCSQHFLTQKPCPWKGPSLGWGWGYRLTPNCPPPLVIATKSWGWSPCRDVLAIFPNNDTPAPKNELDVGLWNPSPSGPLLPLRSGPCRRWWSCSRQRSAWLRRWCKSPQPAGGPHKGRRKRQFHRWHTGRHGSCINRSTKETRESY